MENTYKQYTVYDMRHLYISSLLFREFGLIRKDSREFSTLIRHYVFEVVVGIASVATKANAVIG